MNVPIVTLTTDWGDRDFYVAMVKGKLYSLLSDVRVVDLSHSQTWDSLATVSKIVQYGCYSFPLGTVHIIDVGEDFASRCKMGSRYRPVPLLAECGGHFFLCSNRKLLEYSLVNECDSVVAIPLPEDEPTYTFMAHSHFCDVAAMLLKGAKPADIGEPVQPLSHREFMRAQFDGTILDARLDYIDKYGNATLNLKYSDFLKYRAGRRFRVELVFQVGTSERCSTLTEISSHYSEVRPGNMVLTPTSTGALQLSINQGSIIQLMGVNYSTICRFIFLD